MTLSQSILATLAYHDIFDFPLTLQEIHQYLIGKKINFKYLKKEINSLKNQKKVFQKEDNFYLENRSAIVNLRCQREKYSKTKFKRAVFFASLLRLIPTLKLVAVSGALAMNNSSKNDDIDLVLITSIDKLWTSRFFANLVLYPFRRKPKSSSISNKACLNMFFDESGLKVQDRNIYTAHEIAQLKPIWDRQGVYRRFIKSNVWIKKYLPNWTSSVERLTTNDERKSKSKALVLSHLALVLRSLETLAKWGQLYYMHSKITTEKVDKRRLFFHPANTQERVLTEFNERIGELNIKSI